MIAINSYYYKKSSELRSLKQIKIEQHSKCPKRYIFSAVKKQKLEFEFTKV